METSRKSTKGNVADSYRLLPEDKYEELFTVMQKIEALHLLLVDNSEFDFPDGVGFLMGEQTSQLESIIRSMKRIKTEIS